MYTCYMIYPDIPDPPTQLAFKAHRPKAIRPLQGPSSEEPHPTWQCGRRLGCQVARGYEKGSKKNAICDLMNICITCVQSRVNRTVEPGENPTMQRLQFISHSTYSRRIATELPGCSPPQ